MYRWTYFDRIYYYILIPYMVLYIYRYSFIYPCVSQGLKGVGGGFVVTRCLPVICAVKNISLLFTMLPLKWIWCFFCIENAIKDQHVLSLLYLIVNKGDHVIGELVLSYMNGHYYLCSRPFDLPHCRSIIVFLLSRYSPVR